MTWLQSTGITPPAGYEGPRCPPLQPLPCVIGLSDVCDSARFKMASRFTFSAHLFLLLWMRIYLSMNSVFCSFFLLSSFASNCWLSVLWNRNTTPFYRNLHWFFAISRIKVNLLWLGIQRPPEPGSCLFFFQPHILGPFYSLAKPSSLPAPQGICISLPSCPYSSLVIVLAVSSLCLST